MAGPSNIGVWLCAVRRLGKLLALRPGQSSLSRSQHRQLFTLPYDIQSIQGRVKRSQIVLRCHVAWTIVLIAISSLLIAAGLSTAILDSSRMGPPVLYDFTS